MNDNSNFRHHALPDKTVLHHVYMIDEILGEGGFGITYGGYHKDTGSHVAIKEYFPHTIAVRTAQDGIFSLRPFPGKKMDDYKKGLKRFLNEARILKELQYLDSIVSVYDFFEENGTAYIVMEYIEGLTLGQYIKENGTLSFSELLHLTAPVIHSLSEIHSKGLIHRDISPDNLILGTDNALHLIDFGAASCKNTANTPGTVILKAGYAPPEQYISNSKMGAWIDVYALCATMYFALTGSSPSEAIQRLEQDSLEPLSEPDDLLTWQRAAIEKGLQLRSANRFHDMDELYYALTTPPDTEHAATQMGSRISPRISRRIRRLHYSRTLLFVSGMIAAGVLLVPALILWAGRISNPEPHSVISSSSAPAVTDSSASAAAESPAPGIAATPAAELNPTPGNSPHTQTGLITMPDVTNISLRKARKTLKKLDPSIQVETIYTYDNHAASHVISQSVAKETVFSKGHLSSILLTISKGKKPDKTVSSGKTASSDKTGAPSKTKAPDKTSDKKRNPSYQVRPEEDYQTIHMD